MKRSSLPIMLLASTTIFCNLASAQLNIDNGQMTIQPGATVIVLGDVNSNVNISGTGLLKANGTVLQNINMNGFVIPNLEIANSSNVALAGDMKLSGTLTFTNGKLQLGTNNFTLTSAALIAGVPDNSKFVETNDSGQLRKEINAIGNYTLPVGIGNLYEPIQYQVSGSPSFTNAYLAARSVNGIHPKKHPRSTDYLKRYWKLTNFGVAGGAINATGTYNLDATDITGVETALKALSWNDTAWVAGTAINSASNAVSIPVIAGAKQDLYAMNQFVLLNTKIFLQGAYNASTLLMNDRLRNSGSYVTGVLPASNLLPVTDPYRSAPYNFIHTNNTVPETVVSASFPNPFIDQANPNNNIVDWVFIELRNTVTPGNTILQTRSVLLQRDGDIVDIDGVSPVYFKDVASGSYTIAIKHRNHLAMSINPAVYLQPLKLAANYTTLDFSSSPAANLMGVAGTSYYKNGAVNFLYAGNANFNSTLRWSAPSSDKDYILSSVLSNNAATVLSNVYSAGDMDLNRSVRWSAPNSDKDYILSTPLANNAATVKTQALPN